MVALSTRRSVSGLPGLSTLCLQVSYRLHGSTLWTGAVTIRLHTAFGRLHHRNYYLFDFAYQWVNFFYYDFPSRELLSKWFASVNIVMQINLVLWRMNKHNVLIGEVNTKIKSTSQIHRYLVPVSKILVYKNSKLKNLKYFILYFLVYN